MKKVFLISIFILNVLQAFTIEKPDSLRAIIQLQNISDKDKLQAYEDLSILLQNTDFNECRQVCFEGIDYAKTLKNHVLESSFNTRIGTTWFYSGDYDSTAVYWIKALEISENAQDTARFMSCLNNLGVLNTFTKDYPKSLDYYRKSLQYKIISGNPEAIAITEMNIGINYHYMGYLDSAQAILYKVLPIISNTDNKRAKAILFNNLGSVYTGLEDFENALQYYTLTEDFINLLLVNDKAILYQNKGICFFNLKQREKAIESMMAALDLAIKHDMKALKKSIYENLAKFYYSTKDYKTAFDYLDQYGIIKDSILNMDKDKAIKDIQAKYESAKKDKELLEISQKVTRNQRVIWTLIIIITIVFISSVIISIMFQKLTVANQKQNHNNQQLDLLNQQLIKAKQEIEKALEFKSQFLANMSHEIRTPLNIIMGFNSILKKNTHEAKLVEYIESIELCSNNLLQFLNDILDMSKIEAGKMIVANDKVNLKKLIDDLSRLFILKAEEKGISFTYEFDNSIPDNLMLDEIRLRQILLNLIGNAIKFTDTGYVKIIVKNLKNNKFPNETDINIDVIDTGIGISPDQHSQIFESFRQVKQKNMNQFGGSGLGLTISKRLSEIMNGSLTMVSEPGKGSTFSLKLIKIPVYHGTSYNEDFNESTTGYGIEFTGGSILVADDEILNRKLIKSCFENSPVSVFEAENGIEACNLAKEKKPSVILMDMKMPLMGGIDAAKKIKEDAELIEIPIFVFSASTLSIEKEIMNQQLFSGYISKPLAVDELFYEIGKFLPHIKKQTSENKYPLVVDTDKITKDIKHFISPENLEILEKEIFLLWAEVSESNAINKIIDFAEKLNTFAFEEQIMPLVSYSENLLKACISFNILTIKNLLLQYPEILKSFVTE